MRAAVGAARIALNNLAKPMPYKGTPTAYHHHHFTNKNIKNDL